MDKRETNEVGKNSLASEIKNFLRISRTVSLNAENVNSKSSCMSGTVASALNIG